MNRPARLFISYAREDAELRAQLETHLAALRTTGHVDVWSDSDLTPGDTWEEKTNAKLDAADIVVLLVSADFYASKYAYEIETQRALDRQKRGETRVIPVVVRACQFEATRLHAFQALPKNLKPVALWTDRDEAWNQVVDGIRRVVEGRPLQEPIAPVVPPPDPPSSARWLVLVVPALIIGGLVWAFQGSISEPEPVPVKTTASPSATPAPSGSASALPIPPEAPPAPSQTSKPGPKATSSAPPTSKPSAAPTIRSGSATRNGNIWSLGVPVEALAGAPYVYLVPSPAPEALLGVRPTCSVLVGSAMATCSRSDKAQSVDIGNQATWSLP